MLFKNLRKMFDKITAETRRVKGTIQGNADVIKGLKTITNKNEFFAKLSKMNKQMNANKLRISLSSDGTTLINNQHQVTLSKLSELGKTGRDKLFETFGPAKITSKNVSTRLHAASSVTTPQMVPVKENFINNIRPEEILKIANFIGTLCREEKSFLCELLSEISADVHQAFILLCIDLLSALIPVEEDLLSFLGSGWKMRVVYQVFDYLASQIEEDCDDAQREHTYKRLIKEFIVNGKIKTESLEKLRNMIMKKIKKAWDKNPKPNSNPINYEGLFESRKKSSKKYELQAGEVIKIGIHEVLIRQATVEKLQDYLTNYCENDANLFVELCFQILLTMSIEDVSTLKYVNLDEDVIMRIVNFLIDWNVVEELIDRFRKGDIETAGKLKKEVMDFALVEKRNYEICNVCSGVRYCD